MNTFAETKKKQAKSGAIWRHAHFWLGSMLFDWETIVHCISFYKAKQWTKFITWMFWYVYGKMLDKKGHTNWLLHQHTAHTALSMPVFGYKQSGHRSLITRHSTVWLFSVNIWLKKVPICELSWKWGQIIVDTWQDVEKCVPAMFSKVSEVLGSTYSCRRELLWRWQYSINKEVHHFCFTQLDPELFDCTTYMTKEK